MNGYRLLADAVVVLHFAYVLFVVWGLVAIVAGLVLRRSWARNFWFRVVHLAMIGIVVLEAWVNITCPLTTWENRLRRAGGLDPHELDFIERWLHQVMFFRAPAWVFVVLYSTFGLVVVATFVLYPPRWPGALKPAADIERP